MTRPRGPRQRAQRGRSLVGEEVEVEVGPIAHGGHFVSRHEGRVVFVRHALPGERVTVRITEGDEGSRFLRGDAVAVARPAPSRVTPPCPYAGPDACGGCDFQHVALPEQRELKARVVREQLHRLAGLDVPVEVEPVAGDEGGLRWRTRVRYAATVSGGRGLRKHRSHEVVPVDDCLITRDDARVVEDGSPVVEDGSPVVEERGTSVSKPPSRVVELVETTSGPRRFTVAADGFWQVHPGAPRVLVETVLEMLRPGPGERSLDLYAGVGLFSAFLGDAVGPTGTVDAVEGDREAAACARENLAPYPTATVHQRPVAGWLAGADAGSADLVVLDPPREGARRAVVDGVADRSPRAIAYVACDPAALARDLALFARRGYRLADLRAFDLFPMTHHVECVALLEKRR